MLDWIGAHCYCLLITHICVTLDFVNHDTIATRHTKQVIVKVTMHASKLVLLHIAKNGALVTLCGCRLACLYCI